MPSQSPEPKTRTKPSANLRKLLYIPLLLVISWLAYNLIASDSSLPVIQSQASSGHSAHPKTHVADLPADYLPEVGKHRSSGRLVVVGDVHGMKNSLEELLKKIKFVEGEDHLVLAGDMVSKGPDSAGVVDLAVRLGATGVRGNHEERVIVAQAALEGKESANAETGGEDVGGLEKRENKDKELIKELGRRRIKWLKECPVILRVGKIGGMGQVVVVHAGLAPGVELEMQDRDMVMNMRTIGEDNVPSDEHSGKPWSKVYCLLHSLELIELRKLTFTRYGTSIKNPSQRSSARQSSTVTIQSVVYRRRSTA